MALLVKKIQKFWEFGSGRTAVAAICAHSVSISIGICQGYSAIMIPQLEDSEKYHISSEEASWLASLGAATNPLGSILSGLLAEWFGRKRSIQISGIPFLLGWLCIAFGNSLGWLYAGRLITGIAAGMSSACYTYVSEISTAENRGILQSLGPICASFGIFITYTLGYLLNWLYVARLSLIFCVLSTVLVQFFPESPAYLLKIGKKTESYQSYYWFRRDSQAAHDEVEKNSSSTICDSKACFRDDFMSSSTVKPFLILITLFFLQELSGIYSILFYTVNFFEKTKVNLNNYLSSILVGFIRLAMSIVTAFLINKFGRKTLCVISSSGMSVTMLILCCYFKYYEMNSNEESFWTVFPLIFVAFNVIFSMVGMLPIPWVLVGEMFPLRTRSIMAGLVICIAQCFIFITVKIYPDLVNLLQFSGALMTFFAASLITVVFCYLCLPETKGKSLYEIENYFRNSGSSDGKIERHKTGYCNKGFDLNPEIIVGDSKNSEKIFAINVIQR